MKPNGGNRKWMRTGLTVISVIVLVLLGVSLYVHFSFSTHVRDALKELVRNSSNGRYELHLDDLKLNIWGRRVRVDAPKLTPADSLSPSLITDASAEQLTVTGIGLLSYLWHGEVHIRELRLSGPRVVMMPDSSVDPSSYNGISRNPFLHIEEVGISDAGLRVIYPDSTVRFDIQEIQMNLTDFQVDSSTLQKPPYVSFSSMYIGTGKFSYLFPDRMYRLTGTRSGVSSTESFGFVDSLRLEPMLPKYEFSLEAGHELDRIDLTISRAVFQGIKPIDILDQQGLDIRTVHLEGADLDVFHNKKQPGSMVEKKLFPHMALQELDLQVTVDTLSIGNSRIRYSEHLPGVSTPGSVLFDNLNATISGITNDSSLIADGAATDLRVTTDVMNKAPLRVNASFPLGRGGEHEVSGSLGEMAIPGLNPVLEPLGLMRAADGTIHSIDFDMQMGMDRATGYVRVEYSELTLELLEREDVGQQNSQQFASFLANTFRVRADNTTPPLREGAVDFEYSTDKSIFFYWWKSFSTGLENNIRR